MSAKKKKEGKNSERQILQHLLFKGFTKKKKKQRKKAEKKVKEKNVKEKNQKF